MNTLFESNPKIEASEKEKMMKREIKNSNDNKEGFLKAIKDEEFLWDMRTWEKPKSEYTIADVIKQIEKWLGSEKWFCNCGHTLYCIKKLLEYGWATKEEIAKVILENDKVKYPDEIGTWGQN